MPTREGTTLVLVAAAVFLLATNLMSGLLFVLDALLVALVVVGAGTAVVPVRRLRVTRDAPARSREGEPVAITLTLEAPRGGRFLVVEDGWADARGRAVVPHIERRRPAAVVIRVIPSRRGRYAFGPVAVASRGAVGLFSARRQIALGGQIIVWPRIRPVPPPALPLLAPALDAAGAAQRTRQAEDLYGVRDYQPGDAASRIHWRSSARRGALVVREFERPVTRAATILLDLDRRQAPERLDAAVRAAASVFALARERGLDVILAGWGEERSEHRSWEDAMDWLAGVAPSGPPVAEVLGAFRGGGRALIVVSSGATAPRDPEVIVIRPADDAAGYPATGGLVYTADGTVQAW